MEVRLDTKPKARRVGLLIQELPGELLVYDQERHKAHCLNSTASLIWQNCDGETPVTGIADRLSVALKSPVSSELVVVALEKLSSRHLLDDPPSTHGGNKGPSRREVLRRIGLTAAIALPVVTSIVAPRAAQAATCLPSGSSCSSGAQCCSGVCNGAPSGTCA
jgi:hypothetical protein